MDYQFQYPQAFYLLALIPFFGGIYFLYLLWRRRTLRRVGDPRLVRQLFPTHSPVKATIKFLLLLLTFAAGVVALANPRRPDTTASEARKGIDLVFALDVSNSMLANDIAPNRLTRARQFISRLIDNLQDDRVGLVLFAGNGYLQMPLTFDQSAARLYVSTASPAAIPTQGTAIGDALKKAGVAFGEETERFRSIILITDGETHDEAALDQVKELASKGVMINTVGLGSAEGSAIVDTAHGGNKKDESGQVVISKLNEQLLQQIAAGTNGVYVHLENTDAAVKTVLDQYAGIEKKALGDTSLYVYETFYAWLVAPMVLLLLVELLIPDRKKRKA